MKEWRVVVCNTSHEKTGIRRFDLLELPKKFVYSYSRCLRELRERKDFMVLGLKNEVKIPNREFL